MPVSSVIKSSTSSSGFIRVENFSTMFPLSTFNAETSIISQNKLFSPVVSISKTMNLSGKVIKLVPFLFFQESIQP